jgi:exonuclease SbcD
MRVLHLADVHLDTLFANREPEVRQALRDSSREAFRRAIALAIATRADAVVIAGDLFDSERLSFATEQILMAEAARLHAAEIPLIYATGNHDHGGIGHRSTRLEWPANVTVVSGAAPQRIEIFRDGEAIGCITAAGHETGDEGRDLAATFPRPPGELPEVAVLHTQVIGGGSLSGHHRYAPAELPTLLRAGYDYWALGHVHVRQGLARDSRVWYSGNPQGTNPRETGPKGCLSVDLSDRSLPDVQFHPLAPIRWESLVVGNLGTVESFEDLVRRIESEWRRVREDDSGEGCEWLLRLILEGPSPLYRELSRDDGDLGRALKAELGVLQVEVRGSRVGPLVTPADHLERQDVLGAALRLLEELQSDPGRVRGALNTGGLASGVLDGGDSDGARQLLDGLDVELVARMISSQREARS